MQDLPRLGSKTGCYAIAVALAALNASCDVHADLCAFQLAASKSAQVDISSSDEDEGMVYNGEFIGHVQTDRILDSNVVKHPVRCHTYHQTPYASVGH